MDVNDILKWGSTKGITDLESCDEFKLVYTLHDAFALQELYDRKSKHIEKVIIDGPATILFWGDGTKTVVKNNGPQEPDPEKGILYAIIKKLAPNKKLYNEYLRLIDFELLVEHNTLSDTFALKEVEK